MKLVNGKLSVFEKIGYGVGDTATNLVWRTLMVFLPFFYTDVFGLTAAAVGTLLLVCRFWDGISDLVVGVLADRTNSRWGKFRPWILWTAIPFGILTILTFTTPNLSYTNKLIYAYVTYSGLILIFTATTIPYASLTGVMTSDPIERTSLSSYRFVFAYLGGLITQGFNIYLVAFLGQGNDVDGYKYTMILFSTIAVILFLITFFSVTERVEPIQKQSHPISKDLKDLFSNFPWIILFFIGLLFVTMAGLKQGVTLYYFKYYVGIINLAVGFMILGLLAAMIGSGLTKYFTLLLGKKRVLIYCFSIAFITSLLLFFVSPTSILLIFILSTITEFTTGPIITLFFAMLADAADYSEWKTNRRSTGLFFSAGSVATKFGSGIAGALTGWVLAFSGYLPGGIQPASAILGIKLLISIVPAVAAFAGIIAVLFYKLNEKQLTVIEKELNERRAL